VYKRQTYYSLGQKEEAIADLKDAKRIHEQANEKNDAAQIEALIQEYQADRN